MFYLPKPLYWSSRHMPSSLTNLGLNKLAAGDFEIICATPY